jgi:Fe2+ transport system protein FeoA
MRCQLCGFEFDPNQLTCHAACPLHNHCTIVCCPHCGYRVVDGSRSKLAGWLARWWAPKPSRRAACLQGEPCPLADLPLGTEAEIAALDEPDTTRLARLSVYGLAPGCKVCLLQRHPACVVRTGETELALSDEIVSRIRVRIPDQTGGQ